MSAFVTPKEQQYSNVTSPVEGSALITNGVVKLSLILEYQSIDFLVKSQIQDSKVVNLNLD